MKIIPIFARDQEQAEERSRFFRTLGCEVYRDPNGQLFAVAERLGDWLNHKGFQVFETDQVPPHWVSVADELVQVR